MITNCVHLINFAITFSFAIILYIYLRTCDEGIYNVYKCHQSELELSRRGGTPRLLPSVAAVVALMTWAWQVLKPRRRVISMPLLLHLGFELPEQRLNDPVVAREVGSKRTVDENQLLVGHLELEG